MSSKNMSSKFLSAALVLIGLQAEALSQATPAQDEAQQQASRVLDAFQGHWTLDDDVSKKGDKEIIGTSTSPTPAARLDEVRSVRNAALISNRGQLTPGDQRELERLAGEVDAVFPGSFEAHMAEFYAEFPAPSSFVHIEMAAGKDPGREELIAPQLVNAARKDRKEDLVRCSKAMQQRGGVAPALYQLADDILLSVDKNGLLIAAGEMDAFPLWVLQFASSKRPDMVVMDQRLLVDPAYRARMWERAQARGEVPSDAAAFMDQLPRSTSRPVFLSLAVGASVATKYADRLSITGMAMRFGALPDDLKLLEERWKRMHKATNAGPLARNYLLPGSLLLKHYRATGDEKKAANMEAELRTLAARLGATDQLFRNGVLQH
jgi:hypothetical protein